MTIEALVPDPRCPGSIRIVVDGRPAWTVSAASVAALALSPGQMLSSALTAKIERAADIEAAYRAALRALNLRAHSEHELARKLERRGHRSDPIDAALARLRELGLVDDGAFARNFVATRAQLGRGPIRLRHDLRALGVDPAMIDAALRHARTTTDDPLAPPRELVARRARAMAHVPIETRRRRLLDTLGRRGYFGADARAIVEEALTE